MVLSFFFLRKTQDCHIPIGIAQTWNHNNSSKVTTG